ncbi:MAG TPA: hypothetical protein VD996_01465, partial [Chitinophagaceae bacterium]|nr:hypothetical protein [Chitinophagaceae bacterium]
MRKHLLRIVLIVTAFYFGPDLLAILSEILMGNPVATAVSNHVSIFAPTGFISFLYASIISFLVFYFYYGKQHKVLFVLLCASGIISFICLRYLLEQVLMPAFTGWSNYNPNTTLSYYFFDNLLYGFFYG